jgi:hypothetical protein
VSSQSIIASAVPSEAHTTTVVCFLADTAVNDDSLAVQYYASNNCKVRSDPSRPWRRKLRLGNTPRLPLQTTVVFFLGVASDTCCCGSRALCCQWPGGRGSEHVIMVPIPWKLWEGAHHS